MCPLTGLQEKLKVLASLRLLCLSWLAALPPAHPLSNSHFAHRSLRLILFLPRTSVNCASWASWSLTLLQAFWYCAASWIISLTLFRIYSDSPRRVTGCLGSLILGLVSKGLGRVPPSQSQQSLHSSPSLNSSPKLVACIFAPDKKITANIERPLTG